MTIARFLKWLKEYWGEWELEDFRRDGSVLTVRAPLVDNFARPVQYLMMNSLFDSFTLRMLEAR